MLLTASGEFQHGWVAGAGGGQNGGEMHRDVLGQVMGHASTVDTFVQQHRAVQPLTAIPRLAKPSFGYHTAHTGCHCASEKQSGKVDVDCFKHEICSLLMTIHSVHGEKSNLLTWVIRLIFFTDPVTFMHHVA